ncbi:TadE family protein [Phenylobacterium soli]|uniref:TadE family protein n=1 Tax=Phenylobacterium soli TaxID=2170551 RepID=UPI001402BCCF|nr:TadE family protein [Phenylobacterium soli]
MESAFVLPLVITLLLGVAEIGRIAWTGAALNYAVQEAARCASVRPGVCGTPQQITAYAAARVSQLKVPASAFTTAKLACGVQVQASLDYRFMAYKVFPTAPKLQARTCRP